jgi:hypothetical protein
MFARRRNNGNDQTSQWVYLLKGDSPVADVRDVAWCDGADRSANLSIEKTTTHVKCEAAGKGRSVAMGLQVDE